MLASALHPAVCPVLLAPILAIVAMRLTLSHDLSWYAGVGLFYAGLGLAQLGFLAMGLSRGAATGSAFRDPAGYGRARGAPAGREQA
ncbi:hypothetical protein [Methylobacterium planeticum]|uniref:Uncharacterized protein n=1 Tax=Methylobacterium planeticum TaxID=2615211 RepID=A0A6N6MJ41_9HYPH|nr:hypothetical protein [Methylobacterium planeticum]KAB1071145.1 hypothetical protein F6X51_19785 [Methylobacterium planeticum]